MSQHDTITVNGQTYDAKTGLPIETPRPVAASAHNTTAHSQAIHAAPKRSQTLHRKSLKQPPKKIAPPTRQQRSLDIKPHPKMNKFTQQAVAVATPTAVDTPARVHPHAVKAQPKKSSKKVIPLTSKQKKDIEIKKALATPSVKSPVAKKRLHKRYPRLFSTTVVVICMIIIAGALIWVNLPTISVRLAAAQSGVSAQFPHFLPSGYAVQLPVEAKSSGSVAITFNARSNDTSFTLTQTKSDWDSEAIREMVARESNDQFLTSRDRGLTIYTYNGNANAAWVNKGILYTIKGTADLSSDHILRIANSL